MVIEAHKKGYNDYYKCYSADYCRSTGLPMYGFGTFNDIVKSRLYSASRAKKEHVIVYDTVCGWFRMQHGYIPLFKSKSVDDLLMSELYKYMLYAVKLDRVGDLSNITNNKLRHHCIKYTISHYLDSLIKIAIDESHHDAYLILIDYKHRNGLYIDPLVTFSL